MAFLKNTATGELITRYLNCKTVQQVNLTVQTSLDGTEYLTRFGSPVLHCELELLLTEAGKNLLMQAEASLDELLISVRAGNYLGRILSVGEYSSVSYGWYRVTVILSAKCEVSEE